MHSGAQTYHGFPAIIQADAAFEKNIAEVKITDVIIFFMFISRFIGVFVKIIS